MKNLFKSIFITSFFVLGTGSMVSAFASTITATSTAPISTTSKTSTTSSTQTTAGTVNLTLIMNELATLVNGEKVNGENATLAQQQSAEVDAISLQASSTMNQGKTMMTGATEMMLNSMVMFGVSARAPGAGMGTALTSATEPTTTSKTADEGGVTAQQQVSDQHTAEVARGRAK